MKIIGKMMWHTGSQMHAIHDPAASNDITKQGRKYGNLKIRCKILMVYKSKNNEIVI